MNDDESAPNPPHLPAAMIPANFQNVVLDMTNDLTTTFPEYAHLWSKWQDPEVPQDEIKLLYEYCASIYPHRFFDILYQDITLFDVVVEEKEEGEEEDVEEQPKKRNTFFLPGMDFKRLFHSPEVTETTRTAIWKYLQLILFSVVGSIDDKRLFGDETANVFARLDEKEFSDKLGETVQSLSAFFSKIAPERAPEVDTNQPSSSCASDYQPDQTHYSCEDPDPDPDQDREESEPANARKSSFPNFQNLQDHLRSLFDGKIGQLAQELAEEISVDIHDMLGSDLGEMRSSADILNKMMQDPSKMKDLVRVVGEKLATKMKTGEISQQDLMREIGEFMAKMKSAGAESMDFQQLFKDFAGSLGGRGTGGGTGGTGGGKKKGKPSSGGPGASGSSAPMSMRDRLQQKMILKRAKEAAEQLAVLEREKQYVPYFEETEEKKGGELAPQPPKTGNKKKNKKKSD